MRISVTKLTNSELLKRACSFTTGSPSNISLDRMYRCEHSPIRTQLFCVEMQHIPTFVSVHFVRHKIGVEHFVLSKRDDRGGDTQEDRYTPVNHMMLCNAEALINMARKRLCSQAHHETQRVMQSIVEEVSKVDEALSHYLVPNCLYRGFCPELKSCGRMCGHRSSI